MKTLDEIRSLAVIGAGVMGRGIALVAARDGFNCILFDINQKMLDESAAYIEDFLKKSVERGKISEAEMPEILGRVKYTSNSTDIIGDVIIEAIPENPDLKQKVLSEVEAINSPDTIIASNTSTIPITRIAAGLKRPEMVVGMHFFNPAPLMQLVEVISGEMTADWVAQLIYDLAQKMHKKPVFVKDEPGFIVNRVARPFYVESLRIAEENGASIEAIDRLLESSGFRMGPFKLMDLIGIETNHEVTKSLFNAFFQEPRFRPSRLQQKKVDAGQFGRKTGRGFYSYEK
ncbi:MAG: 3-hydroxybutyryl-CoA dehydrogenase [Bacteroidia bacterium]|nr:3-hydroxybutyryl-CoA dehydrogenase [Bacteroidia bacterium]